MTRPTCALADPTIPAVFRCAIRDRHHAACPCAGPDGGTHDHGRTVTVDVTNADLATWERELLTGHDETTTCPSCPHTALFDCPACRGCLPRQAGDDTTCTVCEQRARGDLAGLPDLYADLAERARVNGLTRAPAGGDDSPPDPMGESGVTGRARIRAHLAHWVATLANAYGRSAPDRDRIVHGTHDIAAYHSGLAARAADLATILATPALAAPVGVHPDPAGAQRAREEAHRHRQLAEAARTDRETGRDIVRALANHIDRHLDVLLADPDTARRVVTDLRSLHRDARRTANRSRDTRQRIVCGCGAWVTLDAEETMTCRNCGAWGVLAWWVEQHAPAVTDEPMTAARLVDWLLVRHGIGVVTLADIRQWSIRHPDKVIRRGKNTRGEQTYEPSAGVLLLAERKASRRIPRPRPESE